MEMVFKCNEHILLSVLESLRPYASHYSSCSCSWSLERFFWSLQEQCNNPFPALAESLVVYLAPFTPDLWWSEHLHIQYIQLLSIKYSWDNASHLQDFTALWRLFWSLEENFCIENTLNWCIITIIFNEFTFIYIRGRSWWWTDPYRHMEIKFLKTGIFRPGKSHSNSLNIEIFIHSFVYLFIIHLLEVCVF